MRLLVTGSREWVDRELMERVLLKLTAGADHVCIVHGAARGADRLSSVVARAHEWSVIAVPADWDRYGRSAGFVRNRFMLEQYAPDLVAAFKVGFDRTLLSGGTEHMVALAIGQGVRAYVADGRSLITVRRPLEQGEML